VGRFYDEFGRRLRRARLAAELTQEQVGAFVGLSRTSVTNIEGGRQQIPLHLLVRLASAVGVSPGELLPEDEDEPRRGKLEHEELLRGLDERSQGWARRVMSAVDSEGGEG
jgi:transcriptional regulator with XRE-family HTH domain